MDTYALEDGVCTRIPLDCPDRTYFNEADYVCQSVSDMCDTYDSANGQCLTCLSTIQLVEDGICINIVDPGCADRQYVTSNGACQDINALCQTF